MKEIKGLHWEWLIITLLFVYCVEFFTGLLYALIFEISFILFVPYFVEGKEWRFFIYES